MANKKEGDLAKSVKGTLWLSVGSAADYLFNIITTYFLARLLTPADYGEVTAITVLVGFADVFWQIGLSQSVIQKKDLTDKDITTAFYINFALVALVTLAIWTLTSFWQSIFNISNGEMLRVYSFIFIINGFLAIPTALLQKKLLFKKVSVANVVSHFAYGISVIILAFWSYGPWALIYGALFRHFVKAIMIVFSERLSYNPLLVNWSSAKVLLNFSAGFTLGKMCNYVATNGDYFVINKTLGKESLGFYQKAYTLLMYPTNLMSTNLDQVFYPLFAKNQDNKRKLANAFIVGNVFIMIIAAPISLLCFFIAKPLITLFLGENWLNTVPPFQVMIVGLFFRTAYKLSISLIKSQGRVYKYATIECVYAILIILFAYIGHFWGVTGVALGTTLAFIANFFLLLVATEGYINFGYMKFLRNTYVPILVIVPFAVLSYIISLFTASIQSDLLICIINTIVILPGYLILMFQYRYKLFTDDIAELLDRVLSVLQDKFKRKHKVKN